MLKINKERNILMKNDNINEKDEKFTEVTPKYYSIDNRYEEYNKPPKKKKSAKKAVAVTSACIAFAACIICGAFVISKYRVPKEKVWPTSADLSLEASADIQRDKSSAMESIAEIGERMDEDDGKLEYNNTHKYKINKKRFSDAVIKELDETVTADYVALYDVTADEFIYMKNAQKKCYPASTTKMLTAIVASSIITDPDTVITVGDEITMIGYDSSIAGLTQGMKLKFETLMDALMIPSGNDAAYTMAVACGRIYAKNDKLSNEEALKVFMVLVNETAQKIGATKTHFTAPDGFHDDNHYTCAADLAKIGDYAKSIPIVANSCAKETADWELVSGEKISWSNSNAILHKDSEYYSEYCDGLKTGFTDEAGTCLVASATIDDHTFIVADMRSLSLYCKYDECNLMLKHAFELYGKKYTYGQQN